MEYFAGLDVSMEDTHICVLDRDGAVVLETKATSSPGAIAAGLARAPTCKRVVFESGRMAPMIYHGLAELGVPVVCIESRQAAQALKSLATHKTDRNDARGIAQMMRVGLYRPVHVKTLASQKRRMLLTSRKLLQTKAIDIDNDLRGVLRNFGLKVGVIGRSGFAARIRELVENDQDLALIIEAMLTVRQALRQQLDVLHRRLLAMVRDDEVQHGGKIHRNSTFKVQIACLIEQKCVTLAQ